MNTPDEDPKPNFDDEFLQEMAKWREKHKLREDDAAVAAAQVTAARQIERGGSDGRLCDEAIGHWLALLSRVGSGT